MNTKPVQRKRFFGELATGDTHQGKWINKLIVAATCCVVFVAGFCLRVADNDLFARMAVGRLIFNSGVVPLHDIFAFTETKSVWIDHEWLSGVIFYWVNLHGGDLSLFGLNIAVGILTMLRLRYAQKGYSKHGVFGSILLFAIVFPISFIWNSTIRAQIFTFLFFSYLLGAIVSHSRCGERRSLSIMPFLFVAWANLHGGFVVGLGFLFLYLVAESLSQSRDRVFLGMILVFSSCSILINPYGADYLAFIFRATTMPRPAITEWMPTRLAPSTVIFWGFGLLVFSMLFSRPYRRIISTEGWFFLVVSFFFGCRHLRLTPFFLMTAAVYLPPVVERFFLNSSAWRRKRLEAMATSIAALSTALIGSAIASGVVLCLGTRSFSLDYSGYPVETVGWLRASRQGGKILAHFDISSFVLYHLGPDFKVAIDGRYEEIYPDSTFDLANRALSPDSPGFSAAFGAINPDYILLCEPSRSLLGGSPFPAAWRIVFDSKKDRCAVLERDVR